MPSARRKEPLLATQALGHHRTRAQSHKVAPLGRNAYDEAVKIVLGIVIAVVVGGACRWADIPSPCPNRLLGALLVLAMTGGYLAMDHLMAK